MARCLGGGCRRAALSLAIVTALAGCASAPYKEVEIRFDHTAAPPLSRDSDDAVVITAVASLMATRLGLPFPDGVTTRIYVNQATFIEGLQRHGSAPHGLAWDRFRLAHAVAGQHGLFVRGDLVAGMDLASRVGLYAHELAHVSQRHMSGGRRRAVAWILEGHAEWVKYRVLDLLSYCPYAESKGTVVRAISRSPVDLPDLTRLERADAWAETVDRLGVAPTYGEAFLAVDWLIELHESAPLHEFFRRLATERTGAWAELFSRPYRRFVADFRDRLEGVRRTGGAAAK